MRIVGGSARSRIIRRPKSHDTRPMMDGTREAIFNALGSVAGLRILDCYAGSGAVGLEAISRGAAHVDGIEIAKAAANTIRRNIKELGFEDSYELWQQSVESWVQKHSERIGLYDLIFVCPPYAKFDPAAVASLTQFLELTGLLILEISSRDKAPELPAMEITKDRKYGDSLVTFYRFKAS